MNQPILVLDTASPTVSVAVGTAESVLAARELELRRSSELLLGAVETCLDEAGLALGELGGVAALRGPGSFTGLRIGLATALGWHQALGIRATALSTLEVLAAVGREERPGGDVIAAVDALRGDWHAQLFPASGPPEPSRLWRGSELIAHSGGRVVGFGVGRLAALPEQAEASGVELVEPPPLAAPALALAAAGEWNPALLVEPVYSRPPAVTLPALKAGKSSRRRG